MRGQTYLSAAVRPVDAHLPEPNAVEDGHAGARQAVPASLRWPARRPRHVARVDPDAQVRPFLRIRAESQTKGMGLQDPMRRRDA